MAYVPSHIRLLRKGRHPADAIKPQLTSMMDMFTIILVFLLKIYSTHGQLINPSDDLTLPASLARQAPEVGLDVTISLQHILVNGKPVESVKAIEPDNVFIIPRLQEELLRYAAEAEKMETLYGAKFSGKAMIQGDRRLPYRLLIKVMATCGQSKYPNMRLVVYQEGE